MSDELETAAVDMVTADSTAAFGAVVRSHSDPMSMTEFVQWMQTAYGTLSVTSVLQQAAFLLCCDVIAQDMAKAPLQLRETLKNGTSKVIGPTDHPIAEFLALDPNKRHTWYEFSEMMGLWHALTSNSFAVVLRDSFGMVKEVLPIQSGRVMERVVGREIFYDIIAGTMQEQALLGAASISVPERNMIHVRGRMLDGMDGYSTLLAGHDTLMTGQNLEAYRNGLFKDGGQQRIIFTRPDKLAPLPDEIFERIRRQFRLLLQNVNMNNEPIVLEGGVDVKPISVNPHEAELTQQFEAQIIATGRLLRIPPHKLFVLANVKYENLDTMEKAYLGDTMEPVLDRHEQRYTRSWVTTEDRRRGLFLQHDRDALQLTDFKAVTDRVIKGVQTGVLEHDEARAAWLYNPLPNGAGQVRTIPANAHLIDRKNDVLIGGTKDQTATDPNANPNADPNAGGNAGDGQGDQAKKAMLRLVGS